VAKQDPNPPPFNPDEASCSAPFFLRWLLWRFKKYCVIHDEEYHYGGPRPWMKDAADSRLYWNIYNDGWWGRMAAGPIYNHVRFYTHNYPPGHPNRSSRVITKVRAWNWQGPGPPK